MLWILFAGNQKEPENTHNRESRERRTAGASGWKEEAVLQSEHPGPAAPFRVSFPRRVLPGRPLMGPPAKLAGLGHEPVNEMGVVFVFGMIAHLLGFVVEALQASFPDCLAKLEVEPGRWQSLRIEFEFESRKFRDHHHDPSQCDMIVCWRHNWKECPAEIQVLELGKVLAHR